MSLYALSPLDGRYADSVEALRPYLSEWALIKYRVFVELRWLAFMSGCDAITHLRRFSTEEMRLLDAIRDDFDDEAAANIKAIERETRHDVKAVEYFIKSRLRNTALSDVVESVHFACTSDDINNLAYALMIRDAMKAVWQPKAEALIDSLAAMAAASADAAMLSRTHGQAASPTTLGKELNVFASRLRRQLRLIERQEYLGKFNGAVGSYNAHVVAYPDMDWLALSRDFVHSLGLAHNPLTTQIEPHDYIAELCHAISRFDTIALDCCRDMWLYISLGYFAQSTVAGEVGSSVMPHKVNPIHFENAEANLGLSNSLLMHLAAKLPVSRLQRDLSDSSAMRNLGVAIGHSFLALTSMRRGLSRISVDREALERDLESAWSTLGEAAQTMMRKHHLPDSYEQLKSLTRGRPFDAAAYRDFVGNLAIPNDDRERLLALTPATYTGLARELALLEDEDANDRDD